MAPRAWKAEQSLQRCADCWPWSMGVRFHPSALSSSSSSSSSCWINLTPDSGSLHTLYCCKQLQQLGAFIEQIIEHLNTCCDPIGQKKMLQICLLGCAEVFRSSGWWEGRRPNWLEQIAGDIGVWGGEEDILMITCLLGVVCCRYKSTWLSYLRGRESCSGKTCCIYKCARTLSITFVAILIGLSQTLFILPLKNAWLWSFLEAGCWFSEFVYRLPSKKIFEVIIRIPCTIIFGSDLRSASHLEG